ncbi:tRNA (adenosine(37)-N6)-threonylcarbamoyltransferase complex dimerization subunit type 1 TsaB [Pararhizobium sp. IMCC21322]|uniref:tRNA (adenosine(37)-N6)-threonylcarbamoyltransferase complex dimerization subunit type 1 TsaB n=1 Tax=Pararhizobium sp. IMCC21322 TaxID=3067903 RepID=UPI00274170CB|nr:tRNA (adenosine(37)-N6)-threonylcarbamoyltransferase complex dimerization subunit type 1 TsaB [Pararhizobium sp. IMCC21322]
MVQLSIDTCNALCAVAVSRWEDGRVQLVARNTQDLGRGHAEVLTGQIATLLSTCGLAPADIDRIAVTKGPGSFTGQRVGLATARVLAATLKIDAIGVDVLDALLLEARALSRDSQAFCAINDARRGAAYVKAVDNSGTVLIDDSLIPVDALPGALAALPKPLCLIGSGLSLLSAENAGEPHFIDTTLPDILSIAELGHTLAVETNPAEPLYLRGADAKPQSAKHVLRPAAQDRGRSSGAAL